MPSPEAGTLVPPEEVEPKEAAPTPPVAEPAAQPTTVPPPPETPPTALAEGEAALAAARTRKNQEREDQRAVKQEIDQWRAQQQADAPKVTAEKAIKQTEVTTTAQAITFTTTGKEGLLSVPDLQTKANPEELAEIAKRYGERLATELKNQAGNVGFGTKTFDEVVKNHTANLGDDGKVTITLVGSDGQPLTLGQLKQSLTMEAYSEAVELLGKDLEAMVQDQALLKAVERKKAAPAQPKGLLGWLGRLFGRNG